MWQANEIEAFFDRLIDMEAQLSDRLGAPSEPRRFVQLKAWLIEEQAILQLLLERFRLRPPVVTQQLPGIRKFATLSLLRVYAAGRRHTGLTGAAAVRLGPNIRSIYLDPTRLTLKINASGADPGNLIREIECRCNLDRASATLAPPMLRTGHDQEDAFILEALIVGPARQPRWIGPDSLEHVIGKLVAYYKDNNVQFLPVSALLAEMAIAGWLSRAKKALAADERAMDWERIDRVLASLTAQGDRLVVLVQGHGDVTPGNFLIDDCGKVFLTDWEFAVDTTMPGDFTKLLRRRPDNRPMIKQAFQNLIPETQCGATLSFGDHHDIGCMLLAFARLEAFGLLKRRQRAAAVPVAGKYLTGVQNYLHGVGHVR